MNECVMEKVGLWVQEESWKIQHVLSGKLFGNNIGRTASPVTVPYVKLRKASNMVKVLPHGPYLYRLSYIKLPIFDHFDP